MFVIQPFRTQCPCISLRILHYKRKLSDGVECVYEGRAQHTLLAVSSVKGNLNVWTGSGKVALLLIGNLIKFITKSFSSLMSVNSFWTYYVRNKIHFVITTATTNTNFMQNVSFDFDLWFCFACSPMFSSSGFLHLNNELLTFTPFLFSITIKFNCITSHALWNNYFYY